MKCVITGKSGLLSIHLQYLDSSLVPLSKEDYDISDKSVIDKLTDLNPDVVIHAGAVTDSNVVNRNPISTIQTNIIGTAHLAQYCIEHGKRLVYISTDYVYDGVEGNHNETDPVLPYNNYEWTKLGGECSVRLVPNHVIIRTSFGNPKFPYDVAFDNLITSKDYVDIIAPMILKIAQSDVTGIINVGTQPKTIFEYASQRNIVSPTKLPTPMNFSLNLNRYEQSF